MYREYIYTVSVIRSVGSNPTLSARRIRFQGEVFTTSSYNNPSNFYRYENVCNDVLITITLLLMN